MLEADSDLSWSLGFNMGDVSVLLSTTDKKGVLVTSVVGDYDGWMDGMARRINLLSLDRIWLYQE